MKEKLVQQYAGTMITEMHIAQFSAQQLNKNMMTKISELSSSKQFWI